MNRFLFSILLASLFHFCTNSDEAISDEVMVDILTDMLIADELLVKYGRTDANNYRDSVKMQILKRYDLDAVEFDSILINTQKDLKNYHLLQSKVGDRLDSLKRVHNEK
tara:strand:+ start:245 stop:571 length:327 start_codon:yes stop_codon:yes gene_type:complete